jgi:1-acyl-sn-glycerol-3-phosphate acyltransferase
MQEVKEIPNFNPKARLLSRLDQPDAKTISRTRLQSFICRLLLLPLGGLLVLMMRASGYSIENIHEIRKQYREIWEKKEKDSPLIICANHLTFIDSALIIWALAPNFWYLFNYKAFTWNLPAGDFFKKKFIYHITLYLTKCIFIHRDGTNEHKNDVLRLCRYLLLQGNVVLIFPEGQRSRKGFFDSEKITAGVGKIIYSLENARVLCIHLRGDKQKSFSNYPPRGSHFKMSMKLIEPHTEKRGKAAYNEIVGQIAGAIKQFENEYFAARSETRLKPLF